MKTEGNWPNILTMYYYYSANLCIAETYEMAVLLPLSFLQRYLIKINYSHTNSYLAHSDGTDLRP